MLFLLIGIATLAMKYFEIGPVATWPWWGYLSPFAMAVAWWTWSDATGYTKKREVTKMENRKQERIDRQRDAMGMLPKKNVAKKRK